MNPKKHFMRMKRSYQSAGAMFFALLFLLVFIIGFSIHPAVKDPATLRAEAKSTQAESLDFSINVIRTPTETLKTESTKTVYYDIPISSTTQDYIFAVSTKYGVPSEVIIAIIERESDYDASATGQAGEQGYMQIHPCNNDWLEREIGVTDLYDPRQNIQSGAFILSDLFKKYDTLNGS